jgi:hypothetical protein
LRNTSRELGACHPAPRNPFTILQPRTNTGTRQSTVLYATMLPGRPLKALVSRGLAPHENVTASATNGKTNEHAQASRGRYVERAPCAFVLYYGGSQIHTLRNLRTGLRVQAERAFNVLVTLEHKTALAQQITGKCGNRRAYRRSRGEMLPLRTPSRSTLDDVIDTQNHLSSLGSR